MNDNFAKPTEEIVEKDQENGGPIKEPTPTTLPKGIPEKFWDTENGEVRVDALAKSYQELERKLGGETVSEIPDGPDGYAVTINGTDFETDAQVNERLHSAGLTQAQVQTVYELANEKLAPLIAEMHQSYEAESQTERLRSHFGSEQKWNEAKRQLSAWGSENLSDEVFAALSGTYDGVMTLQRLMSSNEPGFGKANSIGSGPDESALRTMMSDPKYWRDRDPAFIEKVRLGFQSLYPDG